MHRHQQILALVICTLSLNTLASPAWAGVGDVIGSFELQDFRGKTWALGDFEQSKLVVVAFLGTECPLVKLYSRRLSAMAREFGERKVTFLGINSNQQDSLTEMAYFARVNEIPFPLLKDPTNRVADQFGAERTPEIFVLDHERRVRYHGRIDDQYTYGVQKPTVAHDYLSEAVSALLQGEEVPIAETEVVGCHIGRRLEPDETSEVTYSNQISRILQQRCVECHREGEIAPFSLTEYDEVVGWAEMIREVVREQRMPPWHASPEHGNFENDTRLTDEEQQLIDRWVAAGAPQGDPAQLPPPRKFVEGWRIGEPDLVLYMADEPFAVPAEGEVKYQYFMVDPGFHEDKWIKAAECRPGNRSVVHHIIVAAASRDKVAERLHGDLESDWITATAPGAQPLILPDGMAKFVPAGSKLVFQMHYTPNGTPQTDRSCVGFVFADPSEVKHEVVTQKAANHRFRIPPHAGSHRVEANYTFRKEGLLMAMFPHMHLRGKAFEYTAHFPDGQSEVLLSVPQYDFNWQNSYRLAEPRRIPQGTRLQCVAHFDNSENNLANPDPTQAVRWGDQTWEEMMIGYFDLALLDPPPQVKKVERRTTDFVSQLERVNGGPPRALSDMASEGLQSEEALQSYFDELRQLAPQIDRVDWMTVDGKHLRIRLVAEDPGRAAGRFAAAGIRVPKKGLQLVQYAEAGETVVLNDLSQSRATDLRLLSRVYSSSLHLPYATGSDVGLLNYWSQESEAFPPETLTLFHKLTEKLVGSRKLYRGE